MTAESIGIPEQEPSHAALPRGYELFRAVRDHLISIEQLPTFDTTPEQDQRDSDELDARYGKVCGDCSKARCPHQDQAEGFMRR